MSSLGLDEVFLFGGKGRLICRLFPKILSLSSKEFFVSFHCSLSSLDLYLVGF